MQVALSDQCNKQHACIAYRQNNAVWERFYTRLIYAHGRKSCETEITLNVDAKTECFTIHVITGSVVIATNMLHNRDRFSQ